MVTFFNNSPIEGYRKYTYTQTQEIQNDLPNKISYPYYQRIYGQGKKDMGRNNKQINNLKSIYMCHIYPLTKPLICTIAMILLIGCSTTPSKPEIKIPIGMKLPKYDDYYSEAMRLLEQTDLNTINPFTIKSDLEKNNSLLYGKVKSIKRKNFGAFKRDGKIIKVDPDCSVCNNFFDKYNELGNKIEHITYDNDEVLSHHGYKYKGNEKLGFNYPNEKDIISKELYDKFGNEVVSYFYDEHTAGRVVFHQIDKDRNKIEKIAFIDNQKYSVKWSDPPKVEYAYDSNGRILEKEIFKEFIDYKTRTPHIYLYEKRNYEYNIEGKDEKCFINRYDKDGKIIQIRSYDEDREIKENYNLINNKFVFNERYVLEYDKKGNWNKITVFEKSQSDNRNLWSPTNIVEREITYY